LHVSDVAITAHSGEGLTAVGRGEGVAVSVVLTAVEA
jgi:2C-methyl-D-erythritol 2,4-cyclodiphosphate synthase